MANREIQTEQRVSVAGFSYDIVDPNDREFLKRTAAEIRTAISDTVRAMVQTGARLKDAHPKVPHGHWLDWVRMETGMSETWSRNCMKMHDRFVDGRPDVLETDLQLAPTSLVRLATAPDAAIDEVLSRCRGGEKMIETDVKAVISRYKTTSEPKRRAPEEDGELAGLDALRSFANRARDELAPEILKRLDGVLDVLEKADEKLYQGRKVTKADLKAALWEEARWLTDALEQLTQREASSDVKVTHFTRVARRAYEPGPWADTAAFLREICTSDAFNENVPAARIPEFVERGLKALRGALFY